MTTTDINDLLDQMEKQGAWDSDIDPAPSARQMGNFASLIEHTEMPEDLQILLARTSGCKLSIGNIYIMGYETLDDVHANQPYMFVNVPKAVFFANDNGGGYFFMDTNNSLGWGAEAIFFGRKGGMYNADNYVLCGERLTDFLTAILNGEEVWKRPTLQQNATKNMFKAIVAAPENYTGNPGADLNALYSIVDRYNKGRLPTVLESLLRFRNGITFIKPNITLWDSYTIEPTADTFTEDGSFFAVSFGEDNIGGHYILTRIGEKGDLTNWPFLEGRVMRLEANQPLNEAEYLGYLPELVEQWLKDD